MKNSILIITIFSILTCSNAAGEEMYAHYSRTDHEDEISGKYADIIVSYSPKEKVVFSRKSSYLPEWQTDKGEFYFDEIIEREGDGTELRPDKYNKYSYVRIIENTPKKVVIHWRYMPDFDNVNFDGVVHEIYTFRPRRQVRREIIQGREKLAVFKDPRNTAVQQLELKTDGIEVLSYKPAEPIKTPSYGPVAGSPVVEKTVAKPVCWWKFDEGLEVSEDETLESVSGTNCEIGGNGALWKKGVSGTALAFDGYFTKVFQPYSDVPRITDEITLEAWIALGVYPYDSVAIVQQCDWQEKGWFFGVNEYGRLVMMVSVEGEWERVRSQKRIPLNEWHQVAATFDSSSGDIALYLDGEQTDLEKVSKNEITPCKRDLQIGLNSMKLPASGFPTIVGPEGLIDELKIYDEALSEEQIEDSYELSKPKISLLKRADLQKRSLPVPEGVKGFGAHYVNLKYHDLWDRMWRTTDYSDVAVTFEDLPSRLVFWRGPNYGPGFVTENNKWMIDQSVETGYEQFGCCEHMSDKQCRFSHIRIIENTPARAVVHWRYAFISTLEYRFPDNFPPTNEKWEPYKSWIDEYYTIYPDGVTVRKINNHCGASIYWQDIQFLIPAGETPEDQMAIQALTLGDIQLWGGVRFEKLELSWEKGLPENTLSGANIERVNMKSAYKPFLIFPEGIYVHPWVAGRKGFYSKFVSWNHWPAAQIPSDGRGSVFPDRLSHSALAAADNAVFHGNVAMYGFTNEPIESLVPLTLSWNYPPPVKRVQGANYKGYQTKERAYILETQTDDISFDFICSEVSPVYNPCFVVKHWNSETKADIKIKEDNRSLNPDIRQGIVRDTDGTQTLVIWIDLTSRVPLHIELQ